MGKKKPIPPKDGQAKVLVKEIAALKSKVAVAIGSLEMANLILRSSDVEMFGKNLETLRGMVSRTLSDLKS